MAAVEYSISTQQNFSLSEWLSLRTVIGLLAGVIIYFGTEMFYDREAGLLSGVAIVWLLAGFSGKLLFITASGLLLCTLALSAGNADMQIGDVKVVNKFALWIAYCIALGITKAAIDSFIHSKNKHRGNRTLVKILPTATRSKLDNTLMPLDIKPAPQTTKSRHHANNSITSRHTRPLQF